MKMNRTELKKIMYDFNCISKRLMNANHIDYNMILKKFLAFVKDCEVIKNYLNDCGSLEIDVESAFIEINKSCGRLRFNLGETDEEETASVLGILQYVSENDVDLPRCIGISYSTIMKRQDMLNEFNAQVVFVLIEHIERYLTKIGIDMGLDENVTYNITVTNGQAILARDNSTVNATINNGFDSAKLLELINAVKAQSVAILPKDEMESVQESLDVIETELKQMAPRKSFVKTAISTLKGIKVSNEIKEAAEFSAAMAALIQFLSTSGLL
jgi:tetrahydromethanopterin S-methyltransferase subunit G